MSMLWASVKILDSLWGWKLMMVAQLTGGEKETQRAIVRGEMRNGGGEICLIRPLCGPLFWWQNGNSKENSNFQMHAFIIQGSASTQKRGWGGDFCLSPFSFPLFLGPFYSFPPMACAALYRRCLWWFPYSSPSREAIWRNICSPFPLHYKFSVVGKGAKCNGKASTEKCPCLRRGVL